MADSRAVLGTRGTKYNSGESSFVDPSYHSWIPQIIWSSEGPILARLQTSYMHMLVHNFYVTLTAYGSCPSSHPVHSPASHSASHTTPLLVGNDTKCLAVPLSHDQTPYRKVAVNTQWFGLTIDWEGSNSTPHRFTPICAFEVSCIERVYAHTHAHTRMNESAW